MGSYLMEKDDILILYPVCTSRKRDSYWLEGAELEEMPIARLDVY